MVWTLCEIVRCALEIAVLCDARSFGWVRVGLAGRGMGLWGVR